MNFATKVLLTSKKNKDNTKEKKLARSYNTMIRLKL